MTMSKKWNKALDRRYVLDATQKASVEAAIVETLSESRVINWGDLRETLPSFEDKFVSAGMIQRFLETFMPVRASFLCSDVEETEATLTRLSGVATGRAVWWAKGDKVSVLLEHEADMERLAQSLSAGQTNLRRDVY